MTDSAIPPTKLPVTARAPGKAILFGEHAVVHGRPELLLAIDLYTQLTAEVAESFRLNGDPEALAHHPYFAAAIDRMWSGQPPIDVRTV
ncbi:MAG: hypothetical protein L3J96_07385, partial [Thermoplasmata archaeon]|nr:hypothetical protein [Thermoplasmata archaeon]